MFLPRKILVINFFVAALLAPVAVQAFGASPGGEVLKAQPVAAPLATPAQPAAPQAQLAPPCAKPIRVILPGPGGEKTACAAR